MVWIQSFSCIFACIFFLQQPLMVDALPFNAPKALLKRGGSLKGKFLHITDIHIDPYYLKGATASSYCHRNGSSTKDATGTFGNLGSKCDSPIALVQATFDFLKSSVQDIDFIVYTGDTVRHKRDDLLPRTQDDVTTGHRNVMKYFQTAYNTKNIPYIPTIGNNDSLDGNNLAANASIFSQLKSIWKPLGLNLTSTFSSGGYYVQDVIPGKLTILNLNSMYFFSKDSAVSDCGSSSSPGAVQMKWLQSNLKYYNNQASHQVYIMSHVPPIDDDGSQLYLSDCYSQYLALLGQYGSTIAGHFNGHTNNDYLNAVVPSSGNYSVMSPDSSKADKITGATMALFNAPSIIPVNNPALRVYTYDTDGTDYPVGTIRDWKQYYVDLNTANSNGQVEFQLEYTASRFYGVDHFDGPGVNQAIANVANSKNDLKLYGQYTNVSP